MYLDFVKDIFNVNDSICVECGEKKYLGTLVKMSSELIAIKTSTGITIIKDSDITNISTIESLNDIQNLYKPDSVNRNAEEDTRNCKESVNDNHALNEIIEQDNGESEALLKVNDIATNYSKDSFESSKATSDINDQVSQNNNMNGYQVGDVIPLEVLKKIDPNVNKRNRFAKQKEVSTTVESNNITPTKSSQNEASGNKNKSKSSNEKTKSTIVGKSFEILAPLVQETHELENLKIVPSIGTVSNIQEDRKFGFIHDSRTGHDLYFSFNDIIDNFVPSRYQGLVYTEITNAQGYKAISIHRPGTVKDLLLMAGQQTDKGKPGVAKDIVEQILAVYPENFDAEKLLKELNGKVSHHINPINKTISTELYQKAKLLHDSKRYDEAIEAYKEAIKAHQRRESAIKDLGMLYLFLCNQTESVEKKEEFRVEAIDFMDDNAEYLPQNIVTWSYLENFYYAVREFDKFDLVTDKLLANKQIQSDSQRYVFLLNKKAASFLRRGDKNRAKQYLEKSLKVYPEGAGAIKLLSIIENDNIDLETVFNPSEFETLTSGLSSYIQETLDQYEEYHGVPSKIIESGQFNSVTLNEIRKLIETAGKARARERAKYLLTEGKLMLTIEPDNILKLRSEMARFCNAMAQNHIFENSSMDITRFYYQEAFSLEEKYINTANQVALYLLTHCYTYTQLLNASSKTPSVDEALKIFMTGDLDSKKWESILSMFLYNREISAAITSRLYANATYLEKAKVALSNFGVKLNETPSKDEFVSAWNQVRELRIRDYKHAVTSILSYRNISNLEEVEISMSSNLRDERKDWMCALDLSRLTSIVNNIAPAIDNYIKSSGYRNKEAGYNNAVGQITQLIEEINDGPTRFSYEAIRPLMLYVFDLIENSFKEVIKTSEPRVDVKLLSEETVVDDDNLVSIQVSVSNHKDSSPIREVSVVIQDMPGISFIADNNILYNAIDGGELSIFKLKLKIDDEIRKLKATLLKAICKYKSGTGIVEKSYDLSLKLYSPSDFSEIDNPYSPIADGGPVPITSNMFYGRDEFISNVAKSILNSPSKQIIIYGQKRCGKSSVMLHLKKTLMETNKMFCIFFQ